MKDATRQLLQAQRNWHWVLIAGSLLWLALMGLLYVQPFVTVDLITRDPAAIAAHPPYYGALSNLGILLWSASAAVCFISASLLKIIQPRADVPAFFTFFAWLNTFLCLDDTYLLHENILPKQLPAVQIPEKVVLLMYAVILIGAIVHFWSLLQETQLWLFGLCLLLFGGSVGVDLANLEALELMDITFLVEDGLKLLAIFLWLAYFYRASIDAITRAVKQHS